MALCRAGFEAELAAELSARAQGLGAASTWCLARPESGLVRLQTAVAGEAESLIDTGIHAPVFARQFTLELAWLETLPSRDRAEAIVEALAGLTGTGSGFGTLVFESPDTNDGRGLSRFLRAFRRPMEAQLGRAGLLRPGEPALHLLFPHSGEVGLGRACVLSEPWPSGVPRLRLSRDAPSRSALKLEEGLLRLLNDGERERLLKPGMHAVDLGAAPGGWSWHLARRGLHVTAVDNARLADSAMATEMITHLRTDGFRYRPERPVDWLVCDMVEQPARVTALVADWLCRGLARHAMFNLKLPMKKRLQAVDQGLTQLRARLEETGRRAELRCRQLYHDREEVTVAVITRHDGN
jgi:23S rRNA (cytidine2498-2'-O)-methyltransferase